jgi:predicted HicB family RNase H-like nuclease
MGDTQQLGTRIPQKLYEELGDLAEREHVSLNFLIVEALRDLLHKYEKRGGRKHG